ncbi:hypothetical protein BB559_005224 [Furculomyces boomerangus]|uniref:Uncharacterized protein n=1 Tax=Furculomyces boomerangus TaxID=61424 RepID=A0A2T9Y9X7_9FUNG|nr:hypothetical protein BB559_005224 [Furculomyces boomerangus]
MESEKTQKNDESGWEEISLLDDVAKILSLCESGNDSWKQLSEVMTDWTEKIQKLQSQVSNLPGIHMSINKQKELLAKEEKDLKEKV